MNCPKCGKDVGDSKFCSECNLVVTEYAEQIVPESNAEIKPSEKANKVLQLLKSKWIIVGLLAIVVLVVLIVFLSGNSVKTVPLSYDNEEYKAAFEMSKDEFVEKYDKQLSKNFSESEKQFYTIDLTLHSEENYFATYSWTNTAETIEFYIETDKSTGYIVAIDIWFSSYLDDDLKAKIANNALCVIDKDWADNVSTNDEVTYVAKNYTIEFAGKWASIRATVENR